jgi:HK97 family phage portal protein
VDAIARNAGKLKGTHFIQNGDIKQPAEDKLNRLLQVQPNPYMNAYDMLYKAVTHYYLLNNAFLYIQRDRSGVSGVYPISPSRVEFLQDVTEALFCRFYFQQGNSVILPYSDIVHLRRNFNRNDLLGEDNSALSPALELAHAQNQGIINGIQSGASIRGILKFDQILSPEALKESKTQFIQDYMGMSNQSGVVVTDKKMTYQPITANPVLIDEGQIKATKAKIYEYLGITESIVNSSYDENTWAAFYESTIEPIAVQLGLEFTRKLFTEREQAFGNRVIFESSRLQFASNTTKTNLIKELMPYGLLTINQALEILNLPAVEDGDRRLQTLNVVNADKADEYQTGGTE